MRPYWTSIALDKLVPPTYRNFRGVRSREACSSAWGLDSSRILILRAGIPRPIGNFPESLSQAIFSRDSLSREIGRLEIPAVSVVARPARVPVALAMAT